MSRPPKDYSNAGLFHLLWRDACAAPTYDYGLWVELESRLSHHAEHHPEYKRVRGVTEGAKVIKTLYNHTRRTLVIEVPIETLVFAAEHHPDFYETVRVDDSAVFTQSVATELMEEDEDGSTLVTRMLDRAILDTVARGGEGCSQPVPKEAQ